MFKLNLTDEQMAGVGKTIVANEIYSLRTKMFDENSTYTEEEINFILNTVANKMVWADADPIIKFITDDVRGQAMQMQDAGGIETNTPSDQSE